MFLDVFKRQGQGGKGLGIPFWLIACFPWVSLWLSRYQRWLYLLFICFSVCICGDPSWLLTETTVMLLQGSAMAVRGVQGIGLLLLLLFYRRTQQGKKRIKTSRRASKSNSRESQHPKRY